MYTSVSGHQDSALSRRGRQRDRLPRGRGRQDHQGGAHLELMGAEGEQRITYPTIAAVHVYSQLMLSILYHSYANKDRSCLHLTPSTYLHIAARSGGRSELRSAL